MSQASQHALLRGLQPTLPSPPTCSADVARRRPRAETGCLTKRESGYWVRWRTTDDFVIKTVGREFLPLAAVLSPTGKDVRIRSILDAGANGGYSTAVFARSFPDAQVVAVEPHPGNYAMLKLNTNAFSNVLPIHGGVWGQPAPSLQVVNGSRRIVNDRGYEWQFRTSTAAQPGRGPTAAGVSIPQLLSLAKLQRFDFVKLDVEGAECQVLGCRGAPPTDISWLQGVRVLYIESHDDFDRGSEKAVLSVLKQAGLRVVASFPSWQMVDRTFLACGGELMLRRSCVRLCSEWRRDVKCRVM